MNDIITTAEELDALPVGSVVAWLDCDFEVDGPSVWIKSHDEWYGAGCEDPDGPSFMVDQQFHPGALTVLYRPDQPTEPARVLPSREEVEAALNAPVHAPLNTHDPETGQCVRCPWPVHEMGTDVIADAVLALFANAPTVEQVKAEALREAADDWYDHDDTGHWEPMATDVQSTVLCRDDEEGRAWLRGRADRLAGGGSDE